MKVGLLITARLKSTRLPFKLLKDLNGYSIIEHVINRAKKVPNVDDIILCTSVNSQDRPLVEVAKSNDIYYYLGSEEDVLERLKECADFFSLDYIVSITGENPIFSIDFASRVIDSMLNNHADFVNIEGLPVGCAVYGLSTKALKLVCKIKQEIDTEIWGPLINRPDIFNVVKLQASNDLNIQNLRLTNDYPEDFQLMTKIFSNFPYRSLPSLESVIQLLKENPSFLKINAHCVQKGVDPQILERIDTFYKKNEETILKLKREIYK